MSRLVKLLVVGIVVYVGWVYILPWLRSQPGAGDADLVGAGEGATCVAAARAATETFADEMRRFPRPPIDEAQWDRSYERIDERLREAHAACGCAAEACVAASGALADLGSIVSAFDAAARGDAGPPLNAARDLDRVYARLDEAAALAR